MDLYHSLRTHRTSENSDPSGRSQRNTEGRWKGLMSVLSGPDSENEDEDESARYQNNETKNDVLYSAWVRLRAQSKIWKKRERL